MKQVILSIIGFVLAFIGVSVAGFGMLYGVQFLLKHIPYLFAIVFSFPLLALGMRMGGMLCLLISEIGIENNGYLIANLIFTSIGCISCIWHVKSYNDYLIPDYAYIIIHLCIMLASFMPILTFKTYKQQQGA